MRIYGFGRCPHCGCAELRSTPALDDAGIPTGRVQIRCAACRHGIVQLEPPGPTLAVAPPPEAAEPLRGVAE
jgi:hypothetical protein